MSLKAINDFTDVVIFYNAITRYSCESTVNTKGSKVSFLGGGACYNNIMRGINILKKHPVSLEPRLISDVLNMQLVTYIPNRMSSLGMEN